MGACGADAGAFLDAVEMELEWWPSGDASEASDVWLPSRETQARMTAGQWSEWGRQWDALVSIGEWARGVCAKWQRFVARHADARVLIGHVRPVGRHSEIFEIKMGLVTEPLQRTHRDLSGENSP